MLSSGATAASTSPPPSPAERKGRGCIQINGALMGRQAGARFLAGSHLGRRRWTLRGRGPRSGPEPPAPRLESGRLPKPVLPACVFASWAPEPRAGHSGYGSRRARAPRSQRPGPRARRFLEGPPRQPRCSPAGPPAWGLRKPTQAPGSAGRLSPKERTVDEMHTDLHF